MGFTFSQTDARRIRRQVLRGELSPIEERAEHRVRRKPFIPSIVGRADADIPGLAAFQPGSGTFSQYKIINGSLLDTDVDVTGFNLFESIPKDSFVVLTKHPQTGDWLVIGPDNDDACCASVYEAGTTTYNPGPTTIDLDTVRFQEGFFELTSSGIRMFGDGFATISWAAGAKNSSSVSSENISRVKLRVTPDGGAIADVAGALAHMPHIAAGDGESSCSRPDIMVSVTNGDLFTLEIERIAGSDSLVTLAGASALKICPCPGFNLKTSLSISLQGSWPMEGPGTLGAPAGKYPDLGPNTFLPTPLGTVTLVNNGIIGRAAKTDSGDGGGSLDVDDDPKIRGGQDFTIGIGFNIPTEVTDDYTLIEKVNEYKLEFKAATNKLEWTVNRATTDAVATSTTTVVRGANTIAIVDFDESTITASVEIDDDGTVDTDVGVGAFDPVC